MGTQKGTEMAGEMKTKKETKEEADAVADQKLEKEEIQTQRENLRKDGEEIGHVMPDRHEETLRESCSGSGLGWAATPAIYSLPLLPPQPRVCVRGCGLVCLCTQVRSYEGRCIHAHAWAGECTGRPVHVFHGHVMFRGGRGWVGSVCVGPPQ